MPHTHACTRSRTKGQGSPTLPTVGCRPYRRRRGRRDSDSYASWFLCVINFAHRMYTPVHSTYVIAFVVFLFFLHFMLILGDLLIAFVFFSWMVTLFIIMLGVFVCTKQMDVFKFYLPLSLCLNPFYVIKVPPCISSQTLSESLSSLVLGVWPGW